MEALAPHRLQDGEIALAGTPLDAAGQGSRSLVRVHSHVSFKFLQVGLQTHFAVDLGSLLPQVREGSPGPAVWVSDTGPLWWQVAPESRQVPEVLSCGRH